MNPYALEQEQDRLFVDWENRILSPLVEVIGLSGYVYLGWRALDIDEQHRGHRYLQFFASKKKASADGDRAKVAIEVQLIVRGNSVRIAAHMEMAVAVWLDAIGGWGKVLMPRRITIEELSSALKEDLAIVDRLFVYPSANYHAVTGIDNAGNVDWEPRR